MEFITILTSGFNWNIWKKKSIRYMPILKSKIKELQNLWDCPKMFKNQEQITAALVELEINDTMLQNVICEVKFVIIIFLIYFLLISFLIFFVFYILFFVCVLEYLGTSSTN